MKTVLFYFEQKTGNLKLHNNSCESNCFCNWMFPSVPPGFPRIVEIGCLSCEGSFSLLCQFKTNQVVQRSVYHNLVRNLSWNWSLFRWLIWHFIGALTPTPLLLNICMYNNCILRKHSLLRVCISVCMHPLYEIY